MLDYKTALALLTHRSGSSSGSSIQSDWSVNDETDPAYVKNRTHWVENGETTITWDGETDGRTIVDPSGAGSNLWCKVADDTPVIGSFSTGTMEMASGSATEYSEEAVSANDNLYALCGGAIIVAYADGVSFSGLTLPQKGVYFTKNSGDYVSGWMFGETIYHPLPPELGGMPTLAEDGSDGGKFVKANAAGDGYELTDGYDVVAYENRVDIVVSGAPLDTPTLLKATSYADVKKKILAGDLPVALYRRDYPARDESTGEYLEDEFSENIIQKSNSAVYDKNENVIRFVFQSLSYFGGSAKDLPDHVLVYRPDGTVKYS